ncbi:hypothetical protein DSL64_25345 [Dyadobacter luteus]|uniref:Uncharacterized protein n=2 Tax=Dyadobacter luteus TaxID=2259619 RepID=A0A3D8Y5G4_9BACT|nr:hypothetical protein DSL64_25345 [Dyadobacter luteus]
MCLVTSIFFYACSNDTTGGKKEQEVISSSNSTVADETDEVENEEDDVISSIVLYNWNTLPDSLRSKVSKYNFQHIGSFESRNTYPFNREDAYYIKAAINNIRLAELSKSDAFPVEDVANANPYGLYGNYRNEWAFYEMNGSIIYPTAKFTGFSTIYISRHGEIDTVWIGPVQKRPYKLEIKLKGDYSQETSVYPSINIP